VAVGLAERVAALERDNAEIKRKAEVGAQFEFISGQLKAGRPTCATAAIRWMPGSNDWRPRGLPPRAD
jgi:hypothetical protein